MPLEKSRFLIQKMLLPSHMLIGKNMSTSAVLYILSVLRVVLFGGLMRGQQKKMKCFIVRSAVQRWMVIQMRKSIPLFKVYRKDILTGEVDVFDDLDQRTVERRTGQPMTFLDHWEGRKAWERYQYIVIRKGGCMGQ